MAVRTAVIGFLSMLIMMMKIPATASVCSDSEYEFENKCCNKCIPGTGLVNKCTEFNNTMCSSCVDQETFSGNKSHVEPCRTCTKCPLHGHVARECNRTHDTVCECDPGYYFAVTGNGVVCLVCDFCSVGWGVINTCGDGKNTECMECSNGTYSDISSAIASCLPCTQCTGSQKMLQTCGSNRDAICFDIPKQFHIDITTAHSTPLVPDNYKSGDIDIIPLYCALLGAVVVGLLGYVVFTNYRRMREKARHKGHEPHEEVEYSKASGGDSGVYVETEIPVKTYTLSTRIKDLPQMKKKELEKNLIYKRDAPADNWKNLARELGFNDQRIESIEARAPPEASPPIRSLLHEWSKGHKSTVGKLIRALKTVGRPDAAKILQADIFEPTPTSDVTTHVV